MTDVRKQLEAAFRAAAGPLKEADPAVADAEETRARLVLQQVRGGTRWLEQAATTVSALQTELSRGGGPTGEEAARWLMACCEGWVLRASGPFRVAADQLASRIAASPASVPALLRYWRITGRPADLDRALGWVPSKPSSVPEASAAWAAFRATADQQYEAGARSVLEPLDPAGVPVEDWPLMADVLDLDAAFFADAVARWAAEPPDPSAVIVAAPALVLPALRVVIDWWYDSDMQGGPIAEAATFPYPALRLRFARLPLAAQAAATATLGGVQAPRLEDIGVVAALLGMLVAEVDRTALREAPSRRRRGGLLRG